MRDLLEKYGKEIDVLFAQNDGMMRGALEAMEEAGFVPGKDIIVISVDGDQGAIDLLREGKINCVVECSPLLGPQLMKAVKDLMAGKELPLRIITDEKVYTQENAQQYIRSRKY